VARIESGQARSLRPPENLKGAENALLARIPASEAVNLVLACTYTPVCGSLSEIRTAVRGWEKAILFILLESVLRIPTTEVLSVATTKALLRETMVANF
jgi:hypothetical protein